MKVLFVCIGNICRSPTLEAVCRHMAAQNQISLIVDSCGTSWAHLGERCDPRSFAAAKKRGIMIDHCAQQFQNVFFDQYDLILAVDEEIVEQLKARSLENQHKIHLATEYSERYKGQPIPDPYYLGEEGFDLVLEMAEDCCRGLLKHVE